MREILFRGKRITDGAWVEGTLTTGTWYLDNRPITAISPVDNVFYPHYETSGYEEVIPESVSQFIGLCDKNGRKIFEGDILAHWNYVQEKYTDQCVVEYGEYNCSCCYGVYGWWLNDGDIRCVGEDGEFYEVIGNIQDAPRTEEVKE